MFQITSKRLVNSSLVHSLHFDQISRKSSHNLLSYSANKQTDKQTNGSKNSTSAENGGGTNYVYSLLNWN